jgi:Brp/Blh family beta-carotene 15,15'-monooxygenase
VKNGRRLLACGGLAAAVGAAAAPLQGQMVLSGAAIALLGLPHGASDLAVVPRPRRGSFLVAYLLAMALVVALWQVHPVVGLAGLLALSAAHFALDVPDGEDGFASWGWALLLVGGPAVLHRADLLELFGSLLPSGKGPAIVTLVLHGAGMAGCALVAGRWLQRRTRIGAPRLVGLIALLGLPPLIGFAAGFVLIHAWPQLAERQREIGCADTASYLRRTAPVMAGALAAIGVIAWLFATHPAAPATILFAAIAALATPHMLVTPLWRRATPFPIRPVRI